MNVRRRLRTTVSLWAAPRRPILRVVAGAWIGLAAAGSATASEPGAAKLSKEEGIAFFEKKIRPVLVKNCYSCHAGSVQARGGLRLDTKAGLVIGGQSGPAISTQEPSESKLLSVLNYEGPEMPPAGQLPQEVIDDFKTWLSLGAPDPRGDEGKYSASRKIDFEEARKHWVYQAPKKGEAPSPKQDGWAWSPVDRFILAKQEATGLRPVKDAEPLVWLRRVSFDLVGLPPTAEQVAAIEKDASRDGRAKIVDQLLASPQYGERWGRHWLDVARFAESTGKERNFVYPQAYRYRDWVIDAFNADKPYDQFIKEQVAGDLLPASIPVDRDAQVIATGFLALGPKGINERNRESYLLDIADEQIENVGRAILGLSIGCARCHDHKFDPFTMGDYYSLAGIFRNSDAKVGISNRQQNGGQPNLLVELTGTGTSVASLVDPKLVASIKELERERQSRQDGLRRLREQASPEVLAAVASATPDQTALAQILNGLPDAAGDKSKAKLEEPPKAPDTPAPAPGSFEDIRGKQQAQFALIRKLNGLKEEYGLKTASATAIGLADIPKPKNINIRLRGEADKLGPEVPRGFPQVITVSNPPAIDPAESGRRQLADWLTRGDNPLTARVVVNRLWSKLFGAGIVPTVDDFGDQGQAPTHPELLDYLAVDFVENGWSIKRTLKELVLSRTYQLGSEDDAANLAKDEANEWLWRWNRKRLDAEALRDGILAANGRLDFSRPKGSPVIELGLRELGPNSDFAPVSRPSLQRSVYLPVLRNRLPEALAIFDLPDPSLVAGKREITTSATQGLYLLNSPFVLEQSDHLARKLLDEPNPDEGARIDRAFLAVVARRPTEAERERVRAFLAESTTSGQGGEAAKVEAWTRFAQSLLALPEFRYLF
ncbi:PSD1 and planctomycete cytochrome C domain-containing protein [Singulisphaera sp. PoT]|uniref:PSD1 and planctomycete cytochrome C domain-containing protein n=1 Tax=Singulisphaera sp. PoT TaxID=3411797 RepID=UPI003BF54F5D